jgi:hypothetical protein
MPEKSMKEKLAAGELVLCMRTNGLQTLRWREPDSNHRFRGRRPASS